MNKDERVRVILVSGLELTRHGFVGMLAPYSHRVDVVSVGAVHAGGAVDVAVVDIDSTTAALRVGRGSAVDKHSAGAVALYSWCSEPRTAAPAGGCHSFISKTLNGEDLALALEQIASGMMPAPPVRSGSSHVRVVEEQPRWPGFDVGISQRESDTLRLIAAGFTNIEIAQELYVSVNTVKSYVRAAYRKIGVQRRSEAVRWVIEQGGLTAHPSPTRA